ncbi:hypothetical protein COCOBI_06-6330 [Coccomyxa sp. Obi]|nr:hypothetical protein COCOBI_06-6330 [Coccomyxa sp. Obi]
MSNKRSRQKAHRRREKEKKEATERQFEELSQKVSQLEEEKEQLQGALRLASDTADAEESPESKEVVATFCFGEAAVQLQLTRGAVVALTARVMADIWKRLVHKMAWCLERMGGAPFPREIHFERQIEALVREMIEFYWALVDYNPTTLSWLPSINVEDPSAPGPSTGDPRDWPAILESMLLSEEQAKLLLEFRREWLRETGLLMAERQSLLARLESIDDIEEGVEFASSHLEESGRVMELVRGNAHAMHICRTFYISYANTTMWSPIQSARYSIGCLPMGPDTTSLLACLADQHGEPPTEELIMRAARLGAVTLGPHPGVSSDGPTASAADPDICGGTATDAVSCLGDAATSAARANAGAVASSGAGALSDIGANSCNGANSGASASSGAPSNTDLPSCIAGDWRQAFTTPLRVLHAWDSGQSKGLHPG